MGTHEELERLAETWEKTRWPEFAPFFRQGAVGHKGSSDNLLMWGRKGGVVSCESAELAKDISTVIRQSGFSLSHACIGGIYDILRRNVDIIKLRTDLSFLRLSTPRPATESAASRVYLVHAGTAGLPTDLLETVEHIYAIKDGSRVVSWASNIQVLNQPGRRLYSLRVETHPEHRRRGFGKAVVVAMLNHLAAENAAALWVCDANNVASIGLATSLGFVSHLNVLRWATATGKRIYDH